MRHALLVGLLLLSPVSSAVGQVGIQFNLPSVRIGVRQPVFPRLVLVPGYPVYYDPSSRSNFFFYDGLYWVFARDNWYASDWYNGPWALVERSAVPTFILRVPVAYYRAPPSYFRRWHRDAPPRWGERWGGDWQRQHDGWDRWERREAPQPAPLPDYQRQYSGRRYPRAEQQGELRNQHYRHEPNDAAVRQVFHARPPPPQPQPQSPRAEPGRAAPPASHGRPQENQGHQGHQGKTEGQDGRREDRGQGRGGDR